MRLTGLFEFFGYKPTADYDHLKAEKEELADALARTQQKVIGLEALKAQLEKERASDARALADAATATRLHKARLAWCSPDFVTIPATPEITSHPMVPREIQENIQSIGKALVRPPGDSLFDLCHLERFIRPSRWALYWTLAHAAHATTREVKNLTDEDGLSDKFIEVLTQQIKDLPNTTGVRPPLELGITPIFRKKKPAIKEDVVGADILLVIAGAGLLPTEGARLIWLQAKLNDMANPYQLDYWRPANAKGVFQFDALKAMHQPEKGSLVIYAEYSSLLPFVLCASVGQMPPKAPLTSAESKLDLSLVGHRLQEYVAAATSAQSIGTFSTADDVLEFLKTQTHGALLPLNVLTVCAQDDPRARSILVEIHQHFEVAMGLVPKREKPRDIERGLGW